MELDKEAATLAQEKATLQTEEALIDDFVRCRMEEVERRVNGLFDGVEFRMYKTLVKSCTWSEYFLVVCYLELPRSDYKPD